MEKEHPDTREHPDTKLEEPVNRMAAPGAQENLEKLHQDYIDYNLLNAEVLLALLDQIVPTAQDKKEAAPASAKKS